MGTEPSWKTWVFTNVLFLDPNAPPFISQEEYERRKREAQGNLDSHGKGGGADGDGQKGGRGGGVKRAVPAQTKLRSRVFNVTVDLAGRRSEFQLKCSSEPLSFILMNREGNPLRSIAASYARRVVKKGTTVACEFSPPGSGQGEEAGIRMAFEFIDLNDARAFVDTVKLLYGLFVEEHGITKRAEGDTVKGKVKPRTDATACPVHGDVPCNCNKVAAALGGDEELLEKPEEVSEMPNATSQYPIAIQGNLEAGGILRWSEGSSAGRLYKPKVIEWRVSFVPGCEPQFVLVGGKGGGGDDGGIGDTNLTLDDSLNLNDLAVGKYVQVRAIRRVSGDGGERSGKAVAVYSAATKGPVTLADETARDLLRLIVEKERRWNVELSFTDAFALLPPDATPAMAATLQNLSATQPYAEAALVLLREGLRVEFLEGACISSIRFESFYVTRLASTQSELGNEEDLYLQIHLKKSAKQQHVARVATPSQKDRDLLYHAIYFYKLQKTLKGFDRWSVDLDRGNYAGIKRHYAELWGRTSFYKDVVKATQIYFIEEEERTLNVEEASYYGEREGDEEEYGDDYDEGQQQRSQYPTPYEERRAVPYDEESSSEDDDD